MVQAIRPLATSAKSGSRLILRGEGGPGKPLLRTKAGGGKKAFGRNPPKVDSIAG